MGFCVGAKCDARGRWDLTAQGRELAVSASPMVIDGTDRDILRIIARSPSKLMALARQIGTCPMTARRRINLLAQRGMAAAAADGKFMITDTGLPRSPTRRSDRSRG
jgi:hypothetical protein